MSIERGEPETNERRNRIGDAIAASYNFNSRLVNQRALSELTSPKEGARQSEDLESALAFYRYLQENARDAQIFQNLKELRDSFANEMPYSVIRTGCMDGRWHGEKNIGLPTDFATVIKSAGNNGTFAETDIMVRTKMNEQVLRSQTFSPPKPILWAAMGHYSTTPDRKGKVHSCAYHKNSYRAALEAARKQAHYISNDEKMKRANVYTVFGMTNTDNGLETLHFFSGKGEVVLDPNKIIESVGLHEAKDIFTFSGARTAIADSVVVEHIGNRPPERLFENGAEVFTDRRLGNAMEYFLLKAAKRVLDGDNGDVLNPKLVAEIVNVLDSVQDPPIPKTMKPGILYQVIWNIAHGLYKNRKLTDADDESREKQVVHGEKLIACGTGFELADRGSAFLVSTNEGRSMAGDVELALKLMEHVRETTRREQLGRHPPLIHINIELNEPIGSISRVNNVKARLLALADVVAEAAKDQSEGYRLLTTYSYTGSSNAHAEGKKRFFPVRVGSTDANGSNVESCPIDILANIPLAISSAEEFSQGVVHNENGYLATFAGNTSRLLHKQE